VLERESCPLVQVVPGDKKRHRCDMHRKTRLVASTGLCGNRRLAAVHFSEKSENCEEIYNEFEPGAFESNAA